MELIKTYKKQVCEILSLSWPLIVGNLGQVLIGAEDVFIAAKHGSSTLAAISIANSIIFCILVIGIGLMSAISIVLSNYRGDRKPTKKFLTSIINYSMILATIFCAICLLTVPFIGKMGFEPELVPMIKEYIFICSFSLFGMYLYTCLKEFLLAHENVNFPNLILVAGLVVNFLLAWVLVFGYGPIPALGVVGLAIAALIVRLLMGLTLLIYCLKLVKFRIIFDTTFIKQLVKIGSPIGAAMLLEFLGFNLITILVGRESGFLAGVHNIIVTITSSCYMIPMSVSAAIAIKVGFYNGAKNFFELKKYSIAGTILAVFFMGVCAFILTLWPVQIFEVFSKDPKMVKLGVTLLHIAAFYLMFDGFQVCLSGILKGLKMTKTASVSIIAGYWLFGLPFGYILAYKFNMSLVGFWIGLAASFLCLSVILSTIILVKFKKLRKEYID